jgi:hypothetical protein
MLNDRLRTRVEEHVPHGGSLFVQFKGMSCENNTFRDDSSRVCVQEGTHRNELRGWIAPRTRKFQ